MLKTFVYFKIVGDFMGI